MAFGFCGGQFLSDRFHPAVMAATVLLSAVGGYVLGASKWKHNEEVFRVGAAEEIE